MDDETPRNGGPTDERPDREPAGGRRDPAEDGAPEEAADARESAYALLQRGRELSTKRHHAQAAIVLERAARQAPGKGSILEALGRAYYNSGQHERARATFEALLEIDPSAHYAHYALGQSLKQLGQVRQARTHLRLAVALHPASKLYQGALGRLGPPLDEAESRGADGPSAGGPSPGEAGRPQGAPGEETGPPGRPEG